MNTQNRATDFGTFKYLFQQNRPYATLGVVFTSVAILIICLFIYFFEYQKSPNERYNFEDIKQNGRTIRAKILAVDAVEGITINGYNPTLIKYVFEDNRETITDQFQTMDFAKLPSFPLKPNDVTTVKLYAKQSIIPYLKPFSFSFREFYFLPFMFLAFGLPSLFMSLRPALRAYELCKNGILKNATIIDIYQSAAIIRTNVRKGITIKYEYIDRETLTGHSIVSDLDTTLKYGDNIKIFVSDIDEHNSCIVPILEAERKQWDLKLHQLL
jgi:hypothetical protein